MPDITGQIGGALDSFFASEVVQASLILIGICIVTTWLAAAYWAFRDMHDRTENPVLPYLAGTLVLFGYLLGVLVYRIVRPPERLGDVYERNLAQEALLAEVEAVRTCQTCDRRVDDEWIICPWCRTRLKRVCPNCERLVGLDWTLCAWCGKDFERAASATSSAPAPATSTGQASQAASARPASGGVAANNPATGR
jgi:RNA polymerase subunit RPABC4/transcription elongation factor Spt4